MKQFLLDTNICIYFLKGQFDIDKKINLVNEENCFLSEITIAELKFGIENSTQKERNRKIYNSFIERFKILPIYPTLDIYAFEKARFRSRGQVIDDFDLLIGATANYNDMILVTRNTKDFNRLNGIILENWIIT